MKSQSASNKGFRVALGSFMVAGMLALMLVATLGTSWGVAYGQTAGPTPTTNPCGTTPGSTVPCNENTLPSGGKPSAGPATDPSAVEGSTTKPTPSGSAVNDANQSPVGVVPGLPNTGTGTGGQTDADNGWKLGVLGLLLVTMLVSSVAMLRYRKSATRR